MVDRPVLFSAPMIRALLDGRKTQTRRILNPQPEVFHVNGAECEVQAVHVEGEPAPRIATGQVLTSQIVPFAVGDRLWVKETWRAHRCHDDRKPSDIPADSRVWFEADRDNCDQHGKLRVSIFMPRWASRLTLLVTDVRVERLNACSEADAIAEGIIAYEPTEEDPAEFAYRDGGEVWNNPRSAYAALWDSINGPGAWEKNPWVVVVGFDLHERQIDTLAA